MERRPESSSEGEEKLSRNWLDLPREVTVSILEKLDVVDILENVQRVCTQWESICKDPSFWRTIIFIRFPGQHMFPRPDMILDKMFKQAVELSSGGLINLLLIDRGTNKLLDYVTQRCTQIRRLQLVRTDISDVGLCEAAKRLPLLEDLEISYCNRITAESFNKLGEFCPLLKSLKMNRQGEKYPMMDDSQAVAIAENIVELRHLQLFGNRLTNKGLTTILDYCSHLESLDLRQCFNINLDNSSLGKRCGERIKDFRAPYDSTNDYEFDATIDDYGDDEDVYFDSDDSTNDYEFDATIDYGYGYEDLYNGDSYVDTYKDSAFWYVYGSD